jgi:hypothetical protein
VNITTDDTKYNGIYTIMDTGPKVQGRILDVYMWSCNEALAFGRKQVQITVLRLGMEPEQQLSEPDRSPLPPPRGGAKCRSAVTGAAGRTRGKRRSGSRRRQSNRQPVRRFRPIAPASEERATH